MDHGAQAVPKGGPAKRRRAAGVLVVGLGSSLAPLDAAVNVAFPPITAAFMLPPQCILWVAVCYVLTYTCLILAFGQLGDRIGHRRVFRFGLIVSIAAFGLCAVAPSYAWLLWGRIIQGVAAALVLSCAPALITSLYPATQRTHALAMFASVFAFAGALAPVLGGIAIEWLGWPGVFWFRLPIALISLALLPLLREPAAQSGPSTTRVWWWSSTLAMALREPHFAMLNGISIVINTVVFATWLIGPYYLSRVGGFSATASGLWLALAPIGTMLGAAWVRYLLAKLSIQRIALLGTAMLSLAHVIIAFWSMPANPTLIVVAWLTLGLGLGLFQTAYSDLVIDRFAAHERGLAGSMTMVTRAIGIVLGAWLLSAAMTRLELSFNRAGMTALPAFLAAFQTLFLALAVGLTVLMAMWLVLPASRAALTSEPEKE
jgi:predicted MFS family arabinose efflux permease